MRIVVTGCAGFIGWKVSEKLLKRGDQVVGIDNMNDYYDPRLKEWRLITLRKFENFTFHKEDIADYETMVSVLKGKKFDAVINLAARAGVRASVKDPWIYYETNVTGTLNLLECCRKYDIEKFVLASTSSVYGLNDIPFKEDSFTDTVLSPYAASKKAAEVLCHSYHYLYGLDVTIPRYFTVYGPAGRPDMSIFKFIRKIHEDQPIDVYGDGTQRRSFTYVDDIARGTLKTLRKCDYEIVNLGNSNSVELNYVIQLIEKNLNKKAEINFQPRHLADISATRAKVSKAEKLLNWKPTVDIEIGVKKVANWFLEEQSWLKSIKI